VVRDIGCPTIKEILAVVKIEDREPARRVARVGFGQIDFDVAVVG
jgi:hypothetical protein